MSHIAMIEDEHDYVCDNCNKETILERSIMSLYYEDNNFVRQYFVRCQCGSCQNEEILQINHDDYALLDEQYFTR